MSPRKTPAEIIPELVRRIADAKARGVQRISVPLGELEYLIERAQWWDEGNKDA